MIGTNWLRRKAAGAIRISDARPAAAITLTIDNRDSRYTIPTGFIQIDRTLTEDEVEQIRHQIITGVRAKPDWGEPLTCTCLAIYSRCNYGH
jgi:hypothetical protein